MGDFLKVLLNIRSLRVALRELSLDAAQSVVVLSSRTPF
ncbi:H-NS family histone-like protein [Aeromonas hydrophila]